jgi:hypothetical protein
MIPFEEAKLLAIEKEACRDALDAIEDMESWEEFFEHPKSSEWALWYAMEVINGRWPEAEPYIMKGDPADIQMYAMSVIHGRWPEAEPYIMKEPTWAYWYTRLFMVGRWKDAEPYIMKDSETAYRYASIVINGRWKDAEPYIMKEPKWAYLYALDVLHDRWPDAEKYIKQNKRNYKDYMEWIKCLKNRTRKNTKRP